MKMGKNTNWLVALLLIVCVGYAQKQITLEKGGIAENPKKSRHKPINNN
jgi:hypothetical protein